MPGAVAAHTEPGEIDTRGIDPIGRLEVIDQLENGLLGPPFPGGTLRGGNDEGKIGTFADAFRRPVDADLLHIVAALAGSVEKDDKRPSFLRLRFVALGQGEQVFEFLGSGDLFDKGLLGEFGPGGGEREEGECCQQQDRQGFMHG